MLCNYNIYQSLLASMFNGNTYRDNQKEKTLKKYKSASDLRKEQKKKVINDYLASCANDRRKQQLAEMQYFTHDRKELCKKLV